MDQQPIVEHVDVSRDVPRDVPIDVPVIAPCVVRVGDREITEAEARDTLNVNCGQIRDTMTPYRDLGIPANVSIRTLAKYGELKPVYDLVIKSLNLLNVNPSTAITIDRKLGKGAEGYTFAARININTVPIPFVIKRSTYPGGLESSANVNKKIMGENILSEKLNELRTEIPNFVLTFGSFMCPASIFTNMGIAENADLTPAIRDPVNALCKPDGTVNNIYTVLEPITGTDPRDLIERLLVDEEVATKNAVCKIVFNLMMQICLSLRLADERYGFRHGDLEPRNTLVVQLDAPIDITYRLRGGDVVVNTQYILMILDFGVSSINPCVLGDMENYAVNDIMVRKGRIGNKTVVQDLAGFINYISNRDHVKSTEPRREVRQRFAEYLAVKLREGRLERVLELTWGTPAEVYTKLEALHRTIVPAVLIGGSRQTNKQEALTRYAIMKQNYLDAKQFFEEF